MRDSEIYKFVQQNSDTLRVYPWEVVEEMRENVARLSMRLSRADAETMHLYETALDVGDELKRVGAILAAEKRFDLADILRWASKSLAEQTAGYRQHKDQGKSRMDAMRATARQVDRAKARSIGSAQNYYGGVNVKEDGGEFFWAVENHDGNKWEAIPKSLYDELVRFDDLQRGQDEAANQEEEQHGNPA